MILYTHILNDQTERFVDYLILCLIYLVCSAKRNDLEISLPIAACIADLAFKYTGNYFFHFNFYLVFLNFCFRTRTCGYFTRPFSFLWKSKSLLYALLAITIQCNNFDLIRFWSSSQLEFGDSFFVCWIGKEIFSCGKIDFAFI